MKQTKFIYVSIMFILAGLVLFFAYDMHEDASPALLYLMTVCMVIAVLLQFKVYRSLRVANIAEDEEGKAAYTQVQTLLLVSAVTAAMALLVSGGIVKGYYGSSFLEFFMMFSIWNGVYAAYKLRKYSGYTYIQNK